MSANRTGFPWRLKELEKTTVAFEMYYWLSVIFGGQGEPATILGLFDSKEKAVERLLEDRDDNNELKIGRDTETCVDIVFGKITLTDYGQAMRLEVNLDTRIDV
jgi:hypothetical protein